MLSVAQNRSAQKYAPNEMARRVCWMLLRPFFRFSPRPCFGWRNFLLRCLGATIGRDVNNAIVVEDQFVSAGHAILTFRGRVWYIEDLESTNGTFVNGAPVTEVTPLGYGDVI